jgi:RNA polymerase sigma-70 factor, ECF subfamily
MGDLQDTHLKEIDDAVLVERYRAGDTEAFAELYDRYLPRIYRFIAYKLFDRTHAEDLTSDVFFKVVRGIDTFDEAKAPFQAWIYRIARNVVIDHVRAVKPTVDIEDVFDLGVEDRTPEQIDAIASLAVVSEYLAGLSPKQREIVTLRVWEDRSYKEIAEIVGGSEDSVKMAFSRTIRQLRADLGPHASLALCLLASAQGVTMPGL